MSALPPLNPFATPPTRATSLMDSAGRSEKGFGSLFDSLLADPASLAGYGPSASPTPTGDGQAPWMEALSNAQQRRREAWVRLTGAPMPASSQEMESMARELFQAGLIDTETYTELTASPFDTAQGDVWKEGGGSSTQAFFDTYMTQVAQQAMVRLKG